MFSSLSDSAKNLSRWFHSNTASKEFQLVQIWLNGSIVPLNSDGIFRKASDGIDGLFLSLVKAVATFVMQHDQIWKENHTCKGG